jgi:hypothetical protein
MVTAEFMLCLTDDKSATTRKPLRAAFLSPLALPVIADYNSVYLESRMPPEVPIKVRMNMFQAECVDILDRPGFG